MAKKMPWRQSFLLWSFSPTKQIAILHKWETYEHCSDLQFAPHSLICLTRLLILSARLIAQCACFFHFINHCHHKSMETCSIMMEHAMETPFMCFPAECFTLILFASSRMHISSGSRTGIMTQFGMNHRQSHPFIKTSATIFIRFLHWSNFKSSNNETVESVRMRHSHVKLLGTVGAFVLPNGLCSQWKRFTRWGSFQAMHFLTKIMSYKQCFAKWTELKHLTKVWWES